MSESYKGFREEAVKFKFRQLTGTVSLESVKEFNLMFYFLLSVSLIFFIWLGSINFKEHLTVDIEKKSAILSFVFSDIKDLSIVIKGVDINYEKLIARSNDLVVYFKRSNKNSNLWILESRKNLNLLDERNIEFYFLNENGSITDILKKVI